MAASASPACGRPSEEPTQTTGVFGTVTNKRVFMWRSKGWLRGRRWEEMALGQITSVRLEIRRYVFAGILLAVCGVMVLAASRSSVAEIAGLLMLALCAPALWGLPEVQIKTAGRDLHSTGWPWRRVEAHRFVTAIEQQLRGPSHT